MRGVSEYRDRALAHVVAASQTLGTMTEDIEELRERVAAPDIVGYAIPLHVHIKSLESGLYGLKGRRMRAEQLEFERQIMDSILESADIKHT
jgi:hypothetical protein